VVHTFFLPWFNAAPGSNIGVISTRILCIIGVVNKIKILF
jgi:hypothetical protein